MTCRQFLFCTFALLQVASIEMSQAQVPGVVPMQSPVPAHPAEAPPEQPAAPAETARSVAPVALPNPATINSAAGDYVLSTFDTLEMTVFNEAELATRSRVGSDGMVQLPLLGDVKVAGLTIREARELIRKRYDADYLVNPQVYLNVVDFAERKFTILGQVTKPGTYEFPGGKSLSLLQAIGMAGGFTRTANRGKVNIERGAGSAKKAIIKVNAKKMTVEGNGSFELLPGDIITVEESWF